MQSKSSMVLPLVDEHKPKCYLCHAGFEDLDKLREHQNTDHKELELQKDRPSPVPGDVTMF